MTRQMILVCVFGCLSSASVGIAQTLYFEDFSGGDASHSSVWTDFDSGTTDASSGDLVMSNSPLGFITAPTGVAAVQNLTVASVRTQVTFSGFPTEDSGVSIITNGNTVDGTFYQGGINPTNDSLFISWNQGSNSMVFDSVASGFDVLNGAEIVLQFDVIGIDLSLWAWRLGEEMPPSPQLQFTDDTIQLGPGLPGLLFDGGGSSQTSATYRYFQVASESIPEPAASGFLLAVVCLWLSRYRRSLA